MMWKRAWVGALVAVVCGAELAPSAMAACVGDCDGSGNVTVDEIISAVSVGLGALGVESCASADRDESGSVTVDEIISAVDAALGGCSMGPATPTPSATATIPMGTPTPEGLLFGGAVAELFPHAAGDELTYRVTRSDGRTFIETRRVVSEGVGGTFVVETFESGSRVRSETMRDDGQSLFKLEEVDDVDEVRTTCAPELLQLRMPLRIGFPSQGSSRCDLRTLRGNRFLGQVQQTTAVIPVESIATVDVPAGVYGAVVRVRAENMVGSDAENIVLDLVPEVGIIRSEESSFGFVTRTAVLIEGTIGGVSVGRR